MAQISRKASIRTTQIKTLPILPMPCIIPEIRRLHLKQSRRSWTSLSTTIVMQLFERPSALEYDGKSNDAEWDAVPERDNDLPRHAEERPVCLPAAVSSEIHIPPPPSGYKRGLTAAIKETAKNRTSSGRSLSPEGVRLSPSSSQTCLWKVYCRRRASSSPSSSRILAAAPGVSARSSDAG